MKKGTDAHCRFADAGDPFHVQALTFRSVFQAMAFPGRIVSMGISIPVPDILNSASAAICLTWLNTSTPFWTDIPWNAPAMHWIQDYCECTLVTESYLANLALVTRPEVMPRLDAFKCADAQGGSASATLIVQIADIEKCMATDAPGASAGLAKDFWAQWQAHVRRRSASVDILFTFQNCIAAPPKPA
jgi:phosphonate C-P lyase system protein PhnH